MHGEDRKANQLSHLPGTAASRFALNGHNSLPLDDPIQRILAFHAMQPPPVPLFSYSHISSISVLAYKFTYNFAYNFPCNFPGNFLTSSVQRTPCSNA